MAINTSTNTAWKYQRLAYGAVIACWVTYILLTFLSPQATNDRFHLNIIQTTVLRLTVVVPILLIWLAAIHGAVAFKKYAGLINGSPDARGINLIANGLLWTVVYLVLISILGALIPYFAHTPLAHTMITLRNNIPVITALIAFFMLYRGSNALKLVAQFTTWTRSTPWLFLGYAVFSAVLALAFFFIPTGALGANGLPVYVWPPEVLLFTLILPSLITWFLGILASINLLSYARHVRGIIYQQALRDLVRGIWGIILFAVLLQAFYILNPVMQNLSLGTILLLLYSLLFFYGLGFMFVRSGARKLTRIEMAS